MEKRIYARAVGIMFLKTILNIIVSIAVLITIGKYISPIMYILGMHVSYFVITFLFAEWLFAHTFVRTADLVKIILLTYVIELIIGSSVSAWLGQSVQMDLTLFLDYLVYLAMHGGALFTALYIRKRIFAKTGVAEGLSM